MARLPTPGGDNGNWGDILNEYLSQAHKPDGTLKDNTVTNSVIAPNAVTATEIANGTIQEAQLASSVQTKLNQTTPTWSTLSGKPAVMAAGSDAATARTAIAAVGKGELVVNVRDFGATGASTDSTRVVFQNAIATLPAKGGTLLVPAGTYYDPYLRNAGKSFSVVCDGAKFIQSANVPVILGQGSWGTPRNVTTVTPTTITATVSGLTVAVHQLSVTSADSYFAAGDLVYVYSDDLIEERRPSAGTALERLGQFAVVDSVNGTTVTLTQRLRDAYSTNVRLAKLNDLPFSITGRLEVEAAAQAFTEKWTTALIRINSISGFKMDGLSILNGPSMGVHLRSCYRYHITNYSITNLVDNQPDNQLGYAFADESCEFGYIGPGTVHNCRHGFTDLQPKTEANTDPERYGRPFAATVDAMRVTGSSSGAIAPHHTGEGHTFSNVIAQGGRSTGFGIRGKNHRYINCVSINNPRDFHVYSDSDGGETYGILIDNPTIEKSAHVPGVVAISIANHTGGSDPLVGVRTGKVIATINGGRSRGAAEWLSVTNSIVRLTGDPQVVAPGEMPTSAALITATNSIVETDAITLDVRENTVGVTPRLVQLSDTNSTFQAGTVRIRDTADFNGRMTGFFSASGGNWNMGEVITDVYNPATPPFAGTSTSTYYKARTVTGQVRSNVIARTQSNVTSSYNPSSLLDPVIFVRVASSADSDYILGTINGGNHQGQQLVIYYQNSSFPTRTLTVQNTPAKGTQWEPSGDIVLNHRNARTFVWESAYWRLLT